VAPENCTSAYGDLCTNYNTLLDGYNTCGCGVDPCAADSIDNYNQPLHIGAVFIILAASMFGASAPLLSKYGSRFRVSPYHVCLGKCMGIGVVLACALVHMLQPSSESLTSPCVPYEFNTDYNSYAFLFAMLAGLCMHFLDYVVYQYMLSMHLEAQPSKDVTKDQESLTPEKHGGHNLAHDHNHDHVHSIILDPKVQRTITAYLLEFGVTVHSVFIGLTVGVADYSTLQALLVALCFHQFFEGVALGSRIADANLPSHFNEFLLTFIFSVAAPLGIGIGIAVVATLDANGEGFLLVQGTFDGVCAGILLYIGFMLLFKDFPEDMEKHCRGHPNEKYMRAAMFVCLWLGAGLMAYIGKYL